MRNRYLYKNKHGVYCLRFELLSKSENKYRQLLISLRTKEYHLALRLYCNVMPAIYGTLCEYSNSLRENVSEVPNLNEIKKNIRTQIKRIVEAETDSTAKRWMSDIRYRKLDNYVSDTLSFFELHKDEITSLKKKLSSLETQKSNANETLALIKKVEAFTLSATSSSPHHKESRPIGELVDDYYNFKENSWGARTAKQALSNLIRFSEIIGFETASSEIDGSLIQKYVTVIKGLPRNVGKRRKDITTTDSEAISKWWLETSLNNKDNVLADGGVEKHFSDVRMLIKWLYERHYIALDFSKHLEIAKSKNSKYQEKRDMYREVHLNNIFTSYIYSERLRFRESPKSFHFWAPLIALFTGMRISEIACLEVQDIISKDGTLCFSVNDEWESKDLKDSSFSKSKKSKESIRNIPIAQALLDAGLVEFIGKRKTGLLFYDLKLSDSKGLGNTISKWYNEGFVKYAAIPKKNDKGVPLAFHSFRHTFVSLLDKTLFNGLPLRRDESFYITGHSDSSVRAQTYNHDSYSMDMIKNYIDAIDFGFDLSGISYQRFLRRTTGRGNR